ncbi:MAG: alpha-rhamnosidase [Prevotella sp.]|nr:alpha-rhamnosidase [Prevotella sp.]
MENKKATWIWYPGDFEVWLGNKCNNRRTERGAMFPPFWKQDSHWPTVVFTTTVELAEDESVKLKTEGLYSIFVDGQMLHLYKATIPKGKHTVSIKVWNQVSPPALYLSGTHLKSDSTWKATFEDKIWIDENGVAHGSGVYVPVGFWNFDNPDNPPSQFQLNRMELRPVKKEEYNEQGQQLDGILYDFGREVFGSLKLIGLESGTAYIYYGESREEALDKEHCETLDTISSFDLDRKTRDNKTRIYHLDSKAFRYVYIERFFETWYDDVAVDLEYAPFDLSESGTFRCSDDELNRIWDVSAYTLDLTTREFFIDGIKRDRWTWSGDAIQSYLMNYYLRFDTACVRRTIRQLRGKDPVTAHVNTIMDYTFYWFKSILDYYHYTGDADFVSEIYTRMKTLMDFCLARTNADGMAYGLPGDWIFVDWVDFPMHKRGALCFEQILFWKALQTMAQCAVLLRDRQEEKTDSYAKDAEKYDEMAEKLKRKVRETFWSDDTHALLHAIEDGMMNEQVTRFPNMFAIIYDFATEQERSDILQHVLLNDDVPHITTPYMRFYELEALCQMNCHNQVLKEVKSYWGGMLREGATTFWEKYNPAEKGTQHLAMYGRPYGKSLCHAWGASPLYLLGHYFLGVNPLSAGYETYEVRPVRGGLQWMEGDVPTPFGRIHVRVDAEHICVKSHGGKGRLVWENQSVDIPPNEEIIVDTNQTKI